MNYNKFTKAELISKINSIKKLEVKNNTIFNKIKYYFIKIWGFIIKFKNILLKLSLISVIINFIKKYKWFRKIWTMSQTIIMSIFGLSVLDNFGFEFISNLIMEIRIITGNIADYLTNTHFYQYLSKLFSNNEIPSSKTSDKSWSVIREIENKTSKEKIWNDTHIEQSDRNSKISEWLKPNKPEPEPESSYTLYYIIAGVIITGLAWYYFDDIKDIGFNLIEWLRGNNNPDNDPGDNNDLLNDRVRTRERLERVVKDRILKNEKAEDAPVLEQIIQDVPSSSSSNNKITGITSPSLENLNAQAVESWSEVKSPSSSSSNSSSSSEDTIKPSNPINSDKIKIDSPFPLTPNFLEDSKIISDLINKTDIINSSEIIKGKSLLNVKDTWKDVISNSLKESIFYIENHLPKTELDDTSYLTSKIEDIKKETINFLINLEKNKNEISPNELAYLTQVGKNIDNWISDIENKINKFE
jgi:hypothetical protein